MCWPNCGPPRLHWTVPFAVVAVVLGSMVHAYTWVIGVGTLFAWAWSSFTAATDWWTKLGIGAATLAEAPA